MPRVPILLPAALLLLVVGCVTAPPRPEEGPAAPVSTPHSTPRPGAPAGGTVSIPGDAGELPEVPDRALGLEELVLLAQERNPDLVAAQRRIEQAHAQVLEARAAFLPTLGLRSGFEVMDQPSLAFARVLDARELELATADFNEPGTTTSWELGAFARWGIYEGGRRGLQTRMAEAGTELRELAHDQLRNELAAAVIASFYDVLAARELVNVAQASARTVQAQLEETRTLLEGGATGVRRADVLALEVRLAEAREQELVARNAEALSLAALAADHPLQLSPRDWQPGFIPGAYEEALAQALGQRPELSTARVALRQALLGEDLARSQYRPRVDLVGGAGLWDDELRLEAHDVTWMVGVSSTWDLFRGGARRAALQRAQAAVAEVRARDRKATLAVELDVRSAFLRRQEAEARLGVAEGSIRAAEEALTLSSTLYRGGAATSTRYLEAELALTRARVRETRARYDLRKASADLCRAMGWYVAGCPREGP
jgi:outer membrane protein